MSSKRGRKRNDNLPPNRARDVQRAFRARRAAHLQALEQRVSELEEENTFLRQTLNLPPANRAPLGKGPTGKDKPKIFDGASRSHHSSRDSSSVDSPPSTRANSLSPPSLAGSMRTSPRAVQVIDGGGNWDQSLLLHEPSDSQISSTPASSYQLPPVSTTLPSKGLHYSPYSNSIPPPSNRNSISSGMYMSTSPPSYSHSTDRPLGGTYSPAFVMRSDVRHDSQQQQYSYSHQSFSSSHDSPLPSQSHPSTPSLHSQSHSSQQDNSLPFPHRRSLTEPQGFRTIVNQFPHLPNPAGLNHGMRLPSPPRLQDSANHPRAVYGSEGR